MKLPPLMRRPDGQPVLSVEDREVCRQAWLEMFADRLYGPIPPAPEHLEFRREPIPDDRGERLVLDLSVAGTPFSVDAALWLPEQRQEKLPLIVGLAFLGPAGVLTGPGFPLDQRAFIEPSVANTRRGGRLSDSNRGQHYDRWPLDSLLAAGYGVLLSCYGSWVADHPRRWRKSPLGRAALPLGKAGALSLWAWAYQRLVDIACRLDEVASDRIVLAGHSRLGKAALWAAANDQRVSAVLVNNSGCGGAALSRHEGGETLAKLRSRFPHWTVLDRKSAADPMLLPVDQHQLIACMAPRPVYIASASEDDWADPEGEYLALREAAPFWGLGRSPPSFPLPETMWRPGRRVWSGDLAWHLRPGGHGMTPWDWRRFIVFLERRWESACKPTADPGVGDD